MSRLFTGMDTWNGGFYELGIYLPDRSEQTIRVVLNAIWTYGQVKGCYLDREREPSDQPRLDSYDPAALDDNQLLGVCTLPNQKQVACLTSIVLIDGTDLNWLYFVLPMGALSTAYPVGAYPFADGTPLDWRAEVDDMLVELAHHVYRIVKFPLALTGHEVEFEISLTDIATRGIPEVRYEGYLYPENDILKWYPPNEGAPHVIGRPPDDPSPT